MKRFFTAEHVLQFISITCSVFLIVYLLVYVQQARERVDCQVQVNQALITSVSASRSANEIETTAMDELLVGLLSTGDPDVRSLLRTYQEKRAEATHLRVNNPLPDPRCE